MYTYMHKLALKTYIPSRSIREDRDLIEGAVLGSDDDASIEPTGVLLLVKVVQGLAVDTVIAATAERLLLLLLVKVTPPSSTTRAVRRGR